MRKGDVLVVTKLDRMARSVLDLNIIAKQLQDKQVDLKVLDQDIDTTTTYGKLVFNVLGAVAQFERELINKRVREGVKKAQARGVKFGRKVKIDDDFKAAIIARLQELGYYRTSKAQVAREFNIGRTTLYRMIINEA